MQRRQTALLNRKSARSLPVCVAQFDLPVVSFDSPLSPTSMAVYPDASFVLFSAGLIARFGRDGLPIWRMDSLEGIFSEPLPISGSVAVDPHTGFVYIVDSLGRRFIQLLDRHWADSQDLNTSQADWVGIPRVGRWG